MASPSAGDNIVQRGSRRYGLDVDAHPDSRSSWCLAAMLAMSACASGKAGPVKLAGPPVPGETTPGTADRDGDGIIDRDDGAPLEPEDKDGYEDEDGIPDPVHLTSGAGGGDKGGGAEGGGPSDTGGPSQSAPAPRAGDIDGDGVLDAYDLCVKAAEDRDGFEDEDGCAETDNDGDGVADAEDACPNEPGDECGEAPLLDVSGRVVFVAGSAELDVESSAAAFEEVLSVLRDGKVRRLEIRGHTDSAGPRRKNMALSKKRAAAVKAHLVEQGINAAQITVKGLGPTEPVAANDSPEGRSLNNRIDFAVFE